MALTDLTPLTRVDDSSTPYANFDTSFNIWLSTLVDTLNTDMDRIENIVLSFNARLVALGG